MTFDGVRGVLRTRVGYTGGPSENPTYQSVCAGDGHTEAIRVEYDPRRVSYEELLKVFWDSTTKRHRAMAGNSGDAEEGLFTPRRGEAQYKLAIWYHTEAQLVAASSSCLAQRQRAAAEIGSGRRK